MMSVDKKDIYWVEYAHKNCHPETCCHPANYKLMKNGYAYDYYDDHSQAIADRDLLNARSESAKPAVPEWDGETWPIPPKTKCEFKTLEWKEGTVVCYVNDDGRLQGIVQFDDNWMSFCEAEFNAGRIRPLRTKEQNQREELKAIVAWKDYDVEDTVDLILKRFELKERDND